MQKAGFYLKYLVKYDLNINVTLTVNDLFIMFMVLFFVVDCIFLKQCQLCASE